MSNELHENIIRDNAHRLYSAGELALVDQHYWPDATVRAPGGIYEGHNGVRDFVGRLREAFPNLNLYLHEVLSDKNMVASEWTIEATHTGRLDDLEATGRRILLRGATISVLAKNRIEEERHYWDRTDLRGQLGGATRR